MTTTLTQCGRCGTPAAADSRFCGNCGGPLSASAEVAEDQLLTRLRQATQGEYDVLGELGRGGMAAVYLAWDRDLARHVAVKVLLPELAHHPGMSQRFLQEARTAANLDDHPSVVRVYRAKEADGLRFFVMKFVDGCSLEQLLRASGPLAPELAAHVVDQVAQALQYAHEHGVVHRDVKPGNILLDRAGSVVVTDFGIAKVAEAESLTRTGLAIGTPHYMSPEQWRVQPLTPSSDQYALGVVAHHAITGEVPFDGTQYEIQEGHLRTEPRPLSEVCPDVPPELEAVVGVMLAKRPEERFPDLHSVSRALATVPRAPAAVLRAQLARRIAAAAPDGSPVLTPAGVTPHPVTPHPVTPHLVTPHLVTPHPVPRLRVTPAAPVAASSAAPLPAAAPSRQPTPAASTPAVSIPPVGTQPVGTQPVGTQPVGTQPVGTQPVGTQPVGTQPVGTQPVSVPAVPPPPAASSARPRAVDASPPAPVAAEPVATGVAGDELPAVVTSAEVPLPPSRRRSVVPALAAVGLVVAVGVGVALNRRTSPTTADSTTADSTVAQPPVAAPVAAAPAPAALPPALPPEDPSTTAAVETAPASPAAPDSDPTVAGPAPVETGPRVATGILITGGPAGSRVASLAVGDSIRLVARVNDNHGARMASARVQWSSSDPARVAFRNNWAVGVAPGGPVDVMAASGPLRRAVRVQVTPRAAASTYGAAPTSSAAPTAAVPSDAEVQEAVQAFLNTLRSRDADAIGRRLTDRAADGTASREFVDWVRGARKFGTDAPAIGQMSMAGGAPRVSVRVPIRYSRGGLLSGTTRRDAAFYLTLAREGGGWHAGQAQLVSRFTP